MDFWVRGLRIGPSACNNGWDITNDYFYFRLLRFVKKKEINRRIEERTGRENRLGLAPRGDYAVGSTPWWFACAREAS
jgi:hypothetical protein